MGPDSRTLHVCMHVFIVCLSGYECVHMCMGAYGNLKRALRAEPILQPQKVL